VSTRFRYRHYWLFAFAMPFSRLRHAFATPSACLRDRSCKAFGLSNLCSDYPLNCGHGRRWYLASSAGLNAANGSSSPVLSDVARARDLPGLLLDITFPGRVRVQYPMARCGLNHQHNELNTSVDLTISDAAGHAMCVRKIGLILKHRVRPINMRWSTRCDHL
jgi:hypothetical protein